MKQWVELYEAHTRLRSVSGKGWSSALRTRLRALGEAGHCSRDLFRRFSNKTQKTGLEEWKISGERALFKIAGSKGAELELLVLSNFKTGYIHQLTAMATGIREDGSPWAVAVHLPDDRDHARGADRQGSGACGHAALHCHIGPTLDTSPKLRVPLPALHVVDVIDWLLSQLASPAFEAAPWADVVDAGSENVAARK
jgi:hypothetical protein